MPLSLTIKLSLVALAIVLFLAVQSGDLISYYFFRSFDGFAVLGLVSLWALVGWVRPAATMPGKPPLRAAIVLVAVLLVVLLWAGTHAIMLNYPLSRDEHMVVFDAAIYREGRLFERLPQEWYGFAEALAPAFLLETPDMSLLVSGYLPLNAVLRGLVGSLLAPELTGPLLVASGFLALAWIARHLFEDTPRAQWVALAAYCLSAQVLAMGMTTYAMSAHLTANLIWLALFLKDRWWSHALAMIVGVAAMGLHQFLFHPLFAVPLVLLLAWQRRWLAFGAYAGVYGLGVLFWMSYGGIVVAAAGLETGAGGAAGVLGFVEDRVLPLLLALDPLALQLMLLNLVRALAWNAAFLLPFLIGAWSLARGGKRQDPFVLALFAGIVLTLAAMFVLLPMQGHGWGYRYLHGLLGSCALLAGFGYREWSRAADEQGRRRIDGALVGLGAVGALVMVPAALWSAHTFIAPHAALHDIILQQEADFVIVDDDRWQNAVDETRNRPDLSNSPLVFARRKLTAGQIAELCRRGTVAVIGERHMVEADMIGVPQDGVRPLDNPCG
ncbi:MAG: hypothetical protein WA936_03705 [Erythrobacter sp.]|uniref:hypothetical protein n=1 Tax=Erythrobacter sp. TaxID=1042 RepID=UPI003C74BF8A